MEALESKPLYSDYACLRVDKSYFMPQRFFFFSLSTKPSDQSLKTALRRKFKKDRKWFENINVTSNFNDISNILICVLLEPKENLWSNLGRVEIGEGYLDG